MRGFIVLQLLILVLVGMFTSCSPVFSDLQSARTVGKGKVELTPGITNNFVVEADYTESLQKQAGAQLAIGLTPRLDVRLRYENLRFGAEINDISVMGIGLKYAIVPDIFAVYVPVGGVISKNTEERQFQTQPTLLLSLPIISNKVELNLAGKSILNFDYFDPNMALNMGFGLSTNLKKWAIRPEYGLFYEFRGESELINQLSLGFSWVF